MIAEIILLVLGFIALAIGSYSDLKTRECPDWLNYWLIFAALGIRTIYSLISWDFSYILFGLMGCGIGVAIGYATFYTGGTGGGDSKMLMGLGAVFGIDFINVNSTHDIFQPFLLFIINLAFAGAVYSLVYSLILISKDFKRFVINFREISKNYLRIRKIALVVFILLALITIFSIKIFFVKIIILLVLCAIYLSIPLFIFTKAVEKTSFIKLIPVEKITEGDWIAKDIIIAGKRIAGPKDLGISKKQISQLIALKKRGKIKKVLVKYGIPFLPAYLIAYILVIILGNWITYFV